MNLDFSIGDREGSERFSSFYLDAATSGDDAAWMVILA